MAKMVDSRRTKIRRKVRNALFLDFSIYKLALYLFADIPYGAK